MDCASNGLTEATQTNTVAPETVEEHTMRFLLVRPSDRLCADLRQQKCSYEIVESAAGIERKFNRHNGFFDGVIIPPDIATAEREAIITDFYIDKREIPVVDDEPAAVAELVQRMKASA